MSLQFEFIGEHRCGLGESPLWDPDLRTIYWIDSMAPAIWRHDMKTGIQEAFAAPDRVGSIALGSRGELIAGLADGIYRVDLSSLEFRPILRPEALGSNERLNDGKADRSGRMVTGSLATDPADPTAGKLYRFDLDGSYAILETGIAVSNAICFSPDGDRLYFADSVRRTVWAYDYDAATGKTDARRTLIDTTGLNSVPDGATVDAEGHLWVALVYSQQIARYSPEGILDRLIDVPVPLPTCPAFGGDGLDVLYVSSISDSRGRLKSDHPDAGRLMAIRGLGVRGLAEPRCRL
jgi:sugar lactone lactonase YvrE